MKVDQEILQIIFNELGEKSADLFVDFYRGFPKEEQLNGAKSILDLTIGKSRTEKIISNYLQKKKA